MTKGYAGERFAELHFRTLNWTMFRSQPGTVITRVLGKGKFEVFFKNGGIADYTGYSPSGYYVACEVKEAAGDSMPCSRLDKDQREWMDRLPKDCAWVGIYWVDHGVFKTYQFKEKGAYEYEGS